MSCHVENEDSSHERGMSFVHPDYPEMSNPTLCRNLLQRETFYSIGIQLAFWFLAKREDDVIDDGRS